MPSKDRTLAPKETRGTRNRRAPARNADVPKTSRAKIRMYRQGLGDCFLLTFPGNTETPFHMLIDCGVVLGTPNPADRMRAVVTDVATVTGSHLDLLVATHKHWDHLSGLVQVQSLFDAIQIDRTWLAWTEDPADPLAKKLKSARSRAEEALRMAVTRLGIAGDPQAASVVSRKFSTLVRLSF